MANVGMGDNFLDKDCDFWQYAYLPLLEISNVTVEWSLRGGKNAAKLQAVQVDVKVKNSYSVGERNEHPPFLILHGRSAFLAPILYPYSLSLFPILSHIELQAFLTSIWYIDQIRLFPPYPTPNSAQFFPPSLLPSSVYFSVAQMGRLP